MAPAGRLDLDAAQLGRLFNGADIRPRSLANDELIGAGHPSGTRLTPWVFNEVKPGESIVVSSGRVLVVDDDTDICRVIAAMLEDTPLEAVCVHTDIQAQSALCTPPGFQGLILDINLGQGTTGFDIARFARQAIPEVAVIYISGEAVEKSFLTFGVPNSRFLLKPFSRNDLLDALGLPIPA